MPTPDLPRRFAENLPVSTGVDPPAGTARARKAISIMQRRLRVVSRQVESPAGLEIAANEGIAEPIRFNLNRVGSKRRTAA